MRTQYFVLGAAVAVSAFSYSEKTSAMESVADFNPAMSVIFDGLYYHDNVDGEGPDIIEEHNSALHSHGGHDHEHGELERGFNLRETELVLSGSVDPYFDAWLTASLSSEGIELEEAWFRSNSLPAGLQLKGGKFLSGFGYHNEKHTHSWDFIDQNLAYSSLLGDHGLSGTGLQMTWLAPTEHFWQAGLEVLQGSELERFGTQLDAADIADEIAAEFDPNGTGEFSEEELNLGIPSGPKLGVAFLRFGPDIGTEHALQLGLSAAHHNAMQSFHEEGTDAFVSEGAAHIYSAQAVFKGFAKSAFGKGSYSVQGEYMHFTSDQTATFHTNPAETGLPLALKQDAAYAQATYGFAPRWQVGVRSSAAGFNGSLREGNDSEDIQTSRQHSLALTWDATEFSRLRLQFNHNDIAIEDDNGNAGREKFNQVMLQYNLSLGAHGAHTF
ncbi:MAG: hypothetical protein P1U67_13890 [Alcanivoracaceae bacterium]|nr:hypothetical protein [Alcanivoracaceae bacterium]